MGQRPNGKRIRQRIARRARKLAPRVTARERRAIRAEERAQAMADMAREAHKVPRFLRRLFGCCLERVPR